MAVLVLLGNTPGIRTVAAHLDDLGHTIRNFDRAQDACKHISNEFNAPDLIIADLATEGMSIVDFLRAARVIRPDSLCIVTASRATIGEIVDAMRMGAYDFLAQPATRDAVRQAVASALECHSSQVSIRLLKMLTPAAENYAAGRWARAVNAVLPAPADPKTMNGWAACAYASSGAIRNWCRTAKISPRRSLLFGRLARAVLRRQVYGEEPQQTLNAVDRRTLDSMLHWCCERSNNGLVFPADLEEFVERQKLIASRAPLEAFLKTYRLTFRDALAPPPTPPRDRATSHDQPVSI